MSRLCELTGTKPQFGNNVSHSQRKTRRTFLPNIQSVSFFSDMMQRQYRFKAIASATKLVEKIGGIDIYLISTGDHKLSKPALATKKMLKKTRLANEAKG